MPFSGLEARLLERHLEVHVAGIARQRFQVVIDGRIPVLGDCGVAGAARVPIRGAAWEQDHQAQQQTCDSDKLLRHTHLASTTLLVTFGG
jgi:hypothetical protein